MDNFMANQVMLAYAASHNSGVGEEDIPEDGEGCEEEESFHDATVMSNSDKVNKGSNNVPFWGNAQTMNLNPLIWTNITGSPYFKVNLFGLKTYHEVIDEIYYKVSHLEPWERGSRKTSGQTGMCGGVRGVGAGGIVSSAYCLLYKLFTLKLTRKQVNGMLNHCDSPYIRGLGFMYIRYTQPPGDLWNWFESYLDDEEEIDCKAGGGKPQTIGDMCRQMLSKLEWFDTRFPRIPVSTQKLIDEYMESRYSEPQTEEHQEEPGPPPSAPIAVVEKYPKCIPPQIRREEQSREKESSHHRSSRKEREKSRRSKRGSESSSSRERHRRRRSRSRDRKKSSPSRPHHKSRRRSSSREKSRRHNRDYEGSRTPDYEDELRRYSEHRKKEKSRRRSKSRNRR